MKLGEIENGMKVRISNKLYNTHEKWTTTTEMREMAGGIYKVRHVGTIGVSVYDKWGGSWTFCPEDLTPLTLTPPANPVMFDPKNIGG